MLTALLIAVTAVTGPSPPLYGLAVAGDGDSLRIGETRVRLFGIDAPEFDQECSRGGARWACGQAATAQLGKLVTGREVRCVPVGTDPHERVLARCSVAGVDVNRAMVASGYAVAFRRYSTDYVGAEESAKAARRGLWSGTFEMPAEVRAQAVVKPEGSSTRRAQLRPVQSAPRTTSGCVIKGNQSRRGDWIYHLPGMPYYEQTRPEAVFCTEAEARAAGYRRAIVK